MLTAIEGESTKCMRMEEKERIRNCRLDSFEFAHS
jgi:hypothetical protein